MPYKRETSNKRVKELKDTGTTTLACRHNNQLYTLEFYVTELHSDPVLSIGACKELGLVK